MRAATGVSARRTEVKMNAKLKNIIDRLLVFVIGLPLTLASVFLFPWYNHLILNILVTVFSAFGALEFADMLRKKKPGPRKIEALIYGGLPPLATTLYVSLDRAGWLPAAAVLLCAASALIICAFSSAEKLEEAAGRLTACISVIIYPGSFLACIILMSVFSHSTELIIVFLCTVLINDASAWLFGMLFGRRNRGFVAASPNKSVAGFIGGFLGSMVLCVASSLLWPEIFAAARFSAITSGIILGLTTGLAATTGDLAESALKRGSGIKDSGFIIPGRGGILDSVDSISFAAPIFLIVYNALFLIQ